MKKFGKVLLIGLGFGLVAIALSFLTSKPAPAQHPPHVEPVKVTNIPLPVNASQNGAWNVGVSNFPATQTVSFNGVAQPVSFSNTPTTPVFTRDVDNPVRQPVYGVCEVINQVPTSATGGFLVCNISFTSPTSSFSSVPAGQRLVIEFVSGEADVPTGTKPLEFGIKTGLGTAYTYVNFPSSPFIGTININGIPLDEYKVGQQTRIYEDSNETVSAEVIASDFTYSNPYSFYVTVTGYLVNVR